MIDQRGPRNAWDGPFLKASRRTVECLCIGATEHVRLDRGADHEGAGKKARCRRREPAGQPVQPDPKQAFGSLVETVRAEVRAILRSEVASGELHCADDGIALDSGGAWNAAIWKPYGNMIEIACRRGPGETRRVLVHPMRPSWSPRVLEWPSANFEGELRAAVTTLRT